MYQSARILAVPVADLKNTPRAFQQYVEDYFEKKEMFGKPCMVAFQVLSADTRRKTKGVAPSHVVDLMRYKEGLGGQGLGDWIREEAKNGSLWQFAADWDDGCSGCVLDE